MSKAFKARGHPAPAWLVSMAKKTEGLGRPIREGRSEQEPFTKIREGRSEQEPFTNFSR